jgi:hypothetical protein
MDTDTGHGQYGHGYRNLVSHRQANLEIGYQSQFCHCFPV